METFAAHLWSITAELAPWLLVGLVIAGLFHALLPAGLVARTLRGNAGVVKAVALGVPLPLCSCGVIPAGVGLKKDGASSGAAVGFLIATPQTGVDSILVSASMLGWPFALMKVAAALVTGVVGGWLVERVSPSGEPAPAATACTMRAPLSTRLVAGAGHSLEVLRSIWRWLAFGVVASAALLTWVSPGSLAGALGDSWFLASLVVLLVAVPTYVCATGSVPIAAALVAGGLPLPAALVFLMAGPATSVATIGTVRKHFGGRVALVYVATIVVGSLLFAWLFAATSTPLTAGAAHVHEAHGAGVVSVVAAGLLLAALLTFAWQELAGALRRLKKVEGRPAIELEVGGMTCGGCVAGLERALAQVAGVEGTEVVLDGGRVTVLGVVEREAVGEAVRRAGFTVVRWAGG